MTIFEIGSRFSRVLKKTITSEREDLWHELHDIGCYLAISGLPETALSVWSLAYSGHIPIPDPDDGITSVFGDAAISAVCHKMNHADISQGLPAPRFATRDGEKIIAGDLAKRVAAIDDHCRHSLPGHITKFLALPEAPSDPDFVYRNLPTDDISELTRVLNQLSSQINNRPDFKALHTCDQASMILLAADTAARCGRKNEATQFLKMWRSVSIAWDYNITDALGLTPIVALLCDGALSRKASATSLNHREMINEMIELLRARFSVPEPIKPPVWKHTLFVSYGQFYVEPLRPDRQTMYFQEEGESDQGFSAFPRQVAFETPQGECDCRVEVGFSSKMPSVATATQAVVAPLLVDTADGLCLRTVFDRRNRFRLQVPPGEYDVMARFYPARGAKHDACIGRWRAVLTFMPAGTAKPQCIKKPFGVTPTEVVLHSS
jgi:hypothetical protein